MAPNSNVSKRGLEPEEDLDKTLYVKGGRKFIVGADGRAFVTARVALRYL